MLEAVVATLAVLTVVGILPAVALTGVRMRLIFLSPLIGATVAAAAAWLVFVVGATILPWFVALAATANAAAALGLLVNRRRGAHRPRPAPAEPWLWRILGGGATALVIVSAAAWPLTALRAPIVGYDARAIWILHAVFIFQGHSQMVSHLTNPAYRFSNPDYPPLVPAAGALGFALAGHATERLAVWVTDLLDASALGMLATGVVAAAATLSRGRRMVAVGAGASLCLVGFGIAGLSGIGGYADLLWAAAAAAAVVYGLVLPRSRHHLLVAWICANVAALTKNEGLTTCLVIFVLLAIRYVPAPTRDAPRRFVEQGKRWAFRIALAGAMALPGLVWVATIRAYGLSNSFFTGSPTQPVGLRLRTAADAMATQLHIVWAAAAIAIVGLVALGRARHRLRLAHSAWLWVAMAASIGSVLATYVFGIYEIHWWLSTSVDRTTIFAKLLAFTDVALWLVIALPLGRPAGAAAIEPPLAAATPVSPRVPLAQLPVTSTVPNQRPQ